LNKYGIRRRGKEVDGGRDGEKKRGERRVTDTSRRFYFYVRLTAGEQGEGEETL